MFGIELFACMMLWVVECAACKFMFYLYSLSPAFFELFAFLGYKFVGLAASDLLRVLTNGTIANVALLYFSLMMGVFIVISHSAISLV